MKYPKPGSPEEWLSKSAIFAPHVLLDQKLILDGYRVRFALDFSVLREFLRPWAREELHDEVEAIENIFATAYLTYQMERKAHLGRTLLLPEYLEEYLEHAAYTALTGLYSDWLSMKQAIQKLESGYQCIAGLYGLDAAGREAWFKANIREWTQILSRDFVTLAKLAFSGARYPRANDLPLKLDLAGVFEDPSVYRSYWSDIGERSPYPILYREIYEYVRDVVRKRAEHLPAAQRQRELDRAEGSCRRDAQALHRVIQLNDAFRREGRKEVVYLLSSSHRFWETLNNKEKTEFRSACHLVLQTSAGEVETTVLRHPFCIVLFLAYWPSTNPTNDQESRQHLVSKLSSLHGRASVYQRFVAPPQETPGSISQSDEQGKAYDLTQERFGSWRNLALSLQETELLPPVFSAEGMPKTAMQFLAAIRDLSFGDFRKTLLQQRDIAYSDLMTALYELIEYHMGRIVDAQFLHTRMGHVCAFPYMIAFEDWRILEQIQEFQKARQYWQSGDEDGLRNALNTTRDALGRMLELLQPSDAQVVEAPLLVVALLVLLDQPDEAKQFIRATGVPGEAKLAQELRYLRIMISVRQLLSSENASAKEFAEIADKIDKKARDEDPRLHDRWLLLKAFQLEREAELPNEEDVQEVLKGMVSLASELEGKRHFLIKHRVEMKENLMIRLWNNYVFFLGIFGELLKKEHYHETAYNAAMKHLVPDASKQPTEIKHTIARAMHLYARTLSCKNDRFRILNDALKWYSTVERAMGIAENALPRYSAELQREVNALKKDIEACRPMTSS